MSLQSEYSPDKYVGNGVTTVFPYTFKAFSTTALKAQLVEIADETNIIPLTYSTDYTLSGVNDDNGGNLTLGDMTSHIGSVILPATYRLVIYSDLAYIQEDDLTNQGAYNAETTEDRYDYITRLTQQNEEALTRAVKTDIGSATSAEDLLAEFRQDVADAANSAADAANSATDAANSAADAANSATDAANSAADAAAAVVSVIGTYYTSIFDTFNTYDLSIDGGTAPSVYIDGMQVRFNADAVNITSSVYVNVEGLGKKEIIDKENGLIPGDLTNGAILNLVYNSTDGVFYIVDKISEGIRKVKGVFAIPVRHGSNTYIDFEISSGVAKFSNGKTYFCPAIDKTGNVGYWSPGTGAPIRCKAVIDSGVGGYTHQFAIVNNIGEVDYMLDTDANGVNLYTDPAAISWGIVAHVRIGLALCYFSAPGASGYISELRSKVLPINEYDAEVSVENINYLSSCSSGVGIDYVFTGDFSYIGITSLTKYKFLFSCNTSTINGDSIYRGNSVTLLNFADYDTEDNENSLFLNFNVSTYGVHDSDNSNVVFEKYLSLPKYKGKIRFLQNNDTFFRVYLLGFIDTRE